MKEAKTAKEDKVMNLASPKEISRILGEFQLAPLKKFGQNFLCDQNIVDKIANESVQPQGYVLEIGPGLGVLTQALSKIANKVVSIEIDPGMVEALAHTVGDLPNVKIIHQDFLKLDLEEIYQEEFDGQPFFICGNLPYYITSKCLLKVVESRVPYLSFTAMMQREVAARLQAQAGERDYSAISASIGFFASVNTLFDVSKNCFVPRPDVDSAVVKITPYEGNMRPVDREAYVKVVRGMFAMRRKTIYNNLVKTLGVPKDMATKVLESTGLDASQRAEMLSVDDFIALTGALLSNGYVGK